jgi:hypothetical protein
MDQDEGAFRRLQLIHHSVEESDWWEGIREREVPPLGHSVYSFWVVGSVPAVEALCLLGGVPGEEVDLEETLSGRDPLEHQGVKMPVWNLLETRRCVCQDVFPCGDVDQKQADGHLVRQHQSLFRFPACTPFLLDVGQGHGVVDPPKDVVLL